MSQSFTTERVTADITSITGTNCGPFGDLISVGLTPVTQLDFIYGINTQTGSSTVLNSATVDTSNSRLRLQSGTDSAGSATFQSARIARYRAGQGMIARFTAAWVTSAASSIQVIGVGNATVGYCFGYNGTSFSISRRNGGSDNWVAQSSWNGDKCDGTGPSGFNWNKTFGNVMQIKYPFLGYGAITFWVQNPVTSAWILCHTIQYPNTTDEVQVSNSSFPFYANITNSGNTSNLTMYCGSCGVFIAGERRFLGAQWAVDNNKSGISTETCIFNLRNCTTYNGVANSGVIRLRSLSVGTGATGTNVSCVRLKKGVTIGGTPSYTTINGTTADNGVTITSGNSIASYDVAGTTVTGGTYIYNLNLSSNGSIGMDLTPFSIFISPGEIMTFSAFGTASTSFSVGVNWNEDV